MSWSLTMTTDGQTRGPVWVHTRRDLMDLLRMVVAAILIYPGHRVALRVTEEDA